MAHLFFEDICSYDMNESMTFESLSLFVVRDECFLGISLSIPYYGHNSEASSNNFQCLLFHKEPTIKPSCLMGGICVPSYVPE